MEAVIDGEWTFVHIKVIMSCLALLMVPGVIHIPVEPPSTAYGVRPPDHDSALLIPTTAHVRAYFATPNHR